MVKRKSSVRMWGYIPAASAQRAPILKPMRAPESSSLEDVQIQSVSGGGCGFALAITELGKISSWGSPDNFGQSIKSTGEPQGQYQPYLLDVNPKIAQAAAGWAHAVAVTDEGLLCSWGWKDCVPPSNPTAKEGTGRSAYVIAPALEHSEIAPMPPFPHDDSPRLSGSTIVQSTNGLPMSFEIPFTDDLSTSILGAKLNGVHCPTRVDQVDDVIPSERDLTLAASTSDEISAKNNANITCPSLASVASGVIIISVAAGGRHSLALSDIGQVWGWGYGEEGQLGVGYRLQMTSIPQLVCLEAMDGEGSAPGFGNVTVDTSGTRVTLIACGGRHSAVVTDNGALLTFGWGLYGQCGLGNTDDQLSAGYVSALGGIRVTGLAAGLWHTVVMTDAGDVYATGGNQFGQLGTLGEKAEMLPTLIDVPILENGIVTSVSCGARHTIVLTDEGKVFGWGWNRYGQLGVGDTHQRDSPVEVSLGSAKALKIACGWWHTLALVEDL